MSRYKNGNPHRQSRFICLKCLQENKLAAGIQRKSQRKKFHIKDLTCLNCNGERCKCIEVRCCDSFDEVMDKAKELSEMYYPTENINNGKVG
ncbi:hypothetical protein [uncultured Eubacterium sp.]|uniref:hypothetical protein n=1 Tax=uncultured Eubacterium sp. TaxID=165185 RepID=UPI002597767F|nr:hypothetical protein [uncultured Eubacterium sp.]